MVNVTRRNMLRWLGYLGKETKIHVDVYKRVTEICDRIRDDLREDVYPEICVASCKNLTTTFHQHK